MHRKTAHGLPKPAKSMLSSGMPELATIRVETVLGVMVVLQLIGLSIAAYVIMRRK